MGSVRNVFLDRYETLRNRLIVTSATTFSLNEAFLRVIALRHVLYTIRQPDTTMIIVAASSVASTILIIVF